MAQRIPAVGDIVLVVADYGDPSPVPAIVVVPPAPGDPTLAVVLTIFRRDGHTAGKVGVRYSETPHPGHWSWRPGSAAGDDQG